MKIYLLLIIAVSLGACSKVEKIVVRHENGTIQEQYYVLKPDKTVKNGPYKKHFEDGTLKEEGYYINGKLNDARKLYYTSGQLEIIEHYKQDTFNGAYTSYYASGNLSSEGMYEDNFMAGVWKYYYDMPGKAIKEEIQYVDNIENGPFKEFFENGILKTEGTYKNEIEDDTLKEYDEKGVLIKEIFYQDGKMFKFKSWDSVGNILKDEDYSQIWNRNKE